MLAVPTSGERFRLASQRAETVQIHRVRIDIQYVSTGRMLDFIAASRAERVVDATHIGPYCCTRPLRWPYPPQVVDESIERYWGSWRQEQASENTPKMLGDWNVGLSWH